MFGWRRFIPCPGTQPALLSHSLPKMRAATPAMTASSGKPRPNRPWRVTFCDERGEKRFKKKSEAGQPYPWQPADSEPQFASRRASLSGHAAHAPVDGAQTHTPRKLRSFSCLSRAIQAAPLPIKSLTRCSGDATRLPPASGAGARRAGARARPAGVAADAAAGRPVAAGASREVARADIVCVL